MFPVTLQEARQWAQALRDFDGTVATVKANLDALTALRAKAPSWPAELREQHRVLYAKGRAAYDKLARLKATRDSVRRWLGGLSEAIKRSVGLAELGIAPVIYIGVGLAAFVAAVAAGRAFLADSQAFARRLKVLDETARELIAQGVPPAEAYLRAADVAAKTAGAADAPGTFEKLGMRALVIAGVIAGLYFLVPKLLEYGRHRAEA